MTKYEWAGCVLFVILCGTFGVLWQLSWLKFKPDKTAKFNDKLFIAELLIGIAVFLLLVWLFN